MYLERSKYFFFWKVFGRPGFFSLQKLHTTQVHFEKCLVLMGKTSKILNRFCVFVQ